MTEKLFTPPEIDYLSKDYASFRRLMRDHLAALLPDWQEQNPSDMGNALVELLAYAGDYLSYYQDAVATEAYLGTARRRISIHRHTRLLDYHLHEGCNARALVQVVVNDAVRLPKQTLLATRASAPSVIEAGSSSYSQILSQQIHFFETMHHASLVDAHNEIRFFVPEGADGQLHRGATGATLQDWMPGRSPGKRVLELRAGDILVFKEIRNPETGDEATADPTRRHAVRLTRVFSYFQDGRPLLEIGWHAADALPFPLVLRRYTEDEGQDHVSLACGNIILADYGRTTCKLLAAVEPGQRYAPRLTGRSLTYYEPPAPKLSVREALAQDPRKSRPAVHLWRVGPQIFGHGSPEGNRLPLRGDSGALVYDAKQAQTFFERDGKVYRTIPWTVRQELLSSDPMARDYRVELVASRVAHLKFGFGGMGWQPRAGDGFIAAYRVGAGAVGNVGTGAIAHIILPQGSTAASKIDGVSNLLPAVGGQGRESIETARLLAPANLQTQARCVTLADYEAVARRHPDVEEARALWRWVATSQTVVIHVRRRHGLAVDRDFQRVLQQFMRPYQIVGSDIQVRGPDIVPVYLRLKFTPYAHASRNAIRKSLKDAFSHEKATGFFHRRHFSLGQALHRSQIITHASLLSGIQEVELLHFSSKPLGEKDHDAMEVISVPQTAVIALQDLEIMNG